MNTPGHAVLNLAVLGDGRGRSLDLAVVAGAVVPDLPMVLFYAWARLAAGLPERVVWSEAYFDPRWQAFFDVFNSVPLVCVLLWVAHRRSMRRTVAFGWSSMLHFALDLPSHGSDAHRHFFPLSDFRFESPVSYWDVDSFGAVVGSLEIALVAGLTLFLLLRRYESWWWRSGLLAAVVYYVALAWWAGRYWG